jgi:hypothetical protein
MTQNNIIAFARHLVKRNTKRKRVRIPAMTGIELERFLRTMERTHGYYC